MVTAVSVVFTPGPPLPGVSCVPGPGALGGEADQFVGLSICLVGRTFSNLYIGARHFECKCLFFVAVFIIKGIFPPPLFNKTIFS